ncbi:MAG: hypothetical protein WC797_02925 [Candidatus Paceibacterota bacterium]|jgi:hypothetical protein
MFEFLNFGGKKDKRDCPEVDDVNKDVPEVDDQEDDEPEIDDSDLGSEKEEVTIVTSLVPELDEEPMVPDHYIPNSNERRPVPGPSEEEEKDKRPSRDRDTTNDLEEIPVEDTERKPAKIKKEKEKRIIN